MRDYKDVITAKNTTWKSEARNLMASGVEFVVVHIAPADYRDCMALAQEFDYDCCLEDKSPAREVIIENHPHELPTQLGFVKRGSLKGKSN